MRKIFTSFFCICAVCALPLFTVAQTTPVISDVFYVQSNSLNVTNYADLHNKLKVDLNFVIETACVPAHMLTIRLVNTSLVSNGVNANYESFRLLASQVNISDMQLLTNFSNELFEEQCRNARSNN